MNWKKILFRVLLFIVVVIAALLSYLKFFLPSVGDAPEMKVELTPERVARGEYLATNVTMCVACHSERDFSVYSGPVVEGTIGKGGEAFDQNSGFPGAYYAKNLTPEGLKDYTDGELFRAITSGVNKHGKALFPIMPYPYYGKMDEEDIKSIIAYIRTLKPIKHDVPESGSDFPINFLINTMPQKASFTKKPDPSDQIAYGKYVVNAALCFECHSKFDKGALVEGSDFGGGREFLFPGGFVVRSANLTPDKETGLGNWTEEQFVARFRTGSDSAALARRVKPEDANTTMPWTNYGKMTDQDLKAIYAYLRTVKPVRNSVTKFAKAGVL